MKAKFGYKYDGQRWEVRIENHYGYWSQTPYSIQMHGDDGLFVVYFDGELPSEHESLRKAKDEVDRRHEAFMAEGEQEGGG